MSAMRTTSSSDVVGSAIRSPTISTIVLGLSVTVVIDPAKAHAADCAEIEATIPQYRQCVVEAEAAVRKLRGSSSQVLPGSSGGGSTGPQMSDQYQEMAATCRAAEARARQLLQQCRAGESTAPRASAPLGSGGQTGGRDGADPSVADAVNKALEQARLLTELMRSRFDGAQTVEQLEDLARQVEQLRAAATAAAGHGRPRAAGDFGLPTDSLYDLVPDDEPPRRKALVLDGTGLCTEIEFFPDGTSRGSPPGCGGQGALPEIVFPAPSGSERDAFHQARANDFVETFAAMIQEWTTRGSIAGVPLAPSDASGSFAPPPWAVSDRMQRDTGELDPLLLPDWMTDAPLNAPHCAVFPCPSVPPGS